MALELITENQQTRPGYWVRVGMQFAYAIGRWQDSDKVNDCVGQNLLDAVRQCSNDKNIADTTDDAGMPLGQIFSYLCAAGHVVKAEIHRPTNENVPSASSIWKIQYSTCPQLVGCNLLETSGLSIKDGILVQTLSGDNMPENIVRTWKIVELQNCSLL
jgi:hypothetical protein